MLRLLFNIQRTIRRFDAPRKLSFLLRINDLDGLALLIKFIVLIK